MLVTTFTKNWDLFILGVVVIVTAILGYVVYFQNEKSPTHRSFLMFAIATAFWGSFNYLSYHVQPASTAFIFLRLTIFAVIWETFSFLWFSIVFPSETPGERGKLWWILLPFASVISLLTLTPLVFERIGSIAANGSIAQVVNGPAIPAFGMTSIGFTIAGVIILLWKTLLVRSGDRKPYRLISLGVLFMFTLIISSNFILPVFFNNANYVEFGALFVFPFIILTSYAIISNKIFNVKVFSAEFFIISLAFLSLIQLIQSQDVSEIIVRTCVVVSVLAVGIFLIRSIRREIEQREELQVLNVKLDAANKQLEDLSHFKSELLSLASHQIRSPLAAIKGFGTLIVGGSYGPVPDKIKETVGKMSESADRLIALINTLLDMRKVEEGKMDYQMAPSDLTKIVSDVVDLLKGLAETKKLEFTFVGPGKEVMVNADAEKLKQVIQNLTDNAIKYTPTGFVHVELKEDGPNALVTVTDTGVGFSPDLAPHLFEEFIRDERVKKQILGTGLGLYIAKKIAEAHGGKIWAESPGEGKGSSFHVSVPKAK